MSINHFSYLLAAMLIAIFVFFRPMDVKTEKVKKSEVPLLELTSFTVLEYDDSGLNSTLKGTEGERYSNRYVVQNALFTDSSKKLLQTMQGDHATYQKKTLVLTDNVHYIREDGLKFDSDDLTYKEGKGIATTKGPFVIHQNNDRVDGNRLYYNVENGKMQAYRVRGSYTLNQ
jgi:LPS export ABC transporter protein LptC